MWRLPDLRIIKYPQPVTIGDVVYPITIFTEWTVDQLIAIGIWPFREELFDKTTLESIGYTDEERPLDKEVVRVYTTQPLDPAVIAELQKQEQIVQYTAELAEVGRTLLKLIVVMYQVGVANAVWIKADFTAVDPDIVDTVQALRTTLADLEALLEG